MTYRETIISNLSKAKEAISTSKSNGLQMLNSSFLYAGYIDKALKLLKQDKDRIENLSYNLNCMLEERKAVKPKSGVFLCFCGSCGNPMEKSDRYCSQCGKEVAWH